MLFIGYIEKLNVDNSSCNYKSIGTTFDVRPTICVSFTKERKIQVRWVVVVWCKV
jgi:hypothetical protein